MHLTKITICGGGNGAQTLLPIAARNLSCAVDVYAPFGDEAQRLAAGIATHGGLETVGAVQAKAQPCRISADPAEVIPGSELVLLVLPAFAHEATLRQIAPFLEKSTWVGAIPARGGFDYCAARVLAGLGRPDVRLFGLQTLPWACRIEKYGQVVHVLGVKEAVDVASRPASEVGGITLLLEQMLGLRINAAASLLALTLANTGQIIHPGIMYGLFGGWDGVPFGREQVPLFYQGLSEEGAEALARLSDDVQAIRARLGARLDLAAVRPLAKWLRHCYGNAIADGSCLRNAFVTNRAYAGLEAPVREVTPGQFVPDFGTRYLAEDVPFGLAVSRAIASLAGVETPTMDRVIAWAGERLGKDYLGQDAGEARIPQKYGLDSLERLITFANERFEGGRNSMDTETFTEGKKRRVLAGSIGDCVHSLGVESFAEWMENKGEGFMAVKLGPAVPIDDVVNKIRESRPEIVAISMRLGDLHVDKLISEFIQKIAQHRLLPRESGIRYAFGGLRPAANLVRAMTGLPVEEDKFSPPEDRHYDLDEIAENYGDIDAFQGFFGLIVDDFITMEELEAFAARTAVAIEKEEVAWAGLLLERIQQVRERENRPIIRAHIGIAADSIEPTVKGVEKLAEAQCLEIVSLAPDQPAQEYLAKFVRGEEDPEKHLKGQGGVPIRTKEDLQRLKEATQRGNYPMTRIYSGTDELVELAKLYEGAFRMPFPAVPIFFYNKMDGRGPISIRDSFDEHFEVMRWWAGIDKPVEINDPHQWQLRNSTDDLLVADHTIAGVIALKMGIRKYVMQMMYDLPPGTSGLNDLAKFQAAYELMEPLTRHFDFHIIKETRGGLSDFPPNLDKAKGHLAISTYWQMYMEPDIVHVVSFSEAHHEAKAEDVIESCDIVKQVFEDFSRDDKPDIWHDPRLLGRKRKLKLGAMYNLLHLALLGGYEGPVNLDNFFHWAVSPEEAHKREHPREWQRNYETMLLSFVDEANYPSGQCGMVSADTLDLALQVGLFQAPQITVLDKRYEMVGKCRTRIVDGGCVIDEFNGVKVADEIERVDRLRERSPWFFDKSIKHADEDLYITETAEAIDEEVLSRARRQVGIHRPAELDNKRVLVVDFGSTFSKIGTFDTATEEFSMHYVPTIVEDLRASLADGLNVLDECQQRGDWEPLSQAISQFDIRLPCSSAKGGLKMVTVSMVKEESGFAADLAALTAGAKLLNSYEGALTEAQAQAIYEQDQPEIILQAGGVDFGGDTQTQLHNARMLAKSSRAATYARYGVPVIYAGNQDVRDEIAAIYKAKGVDIRLTPNVMPEINQFRIEVVNEAIRELFQTIIIRGKGFDVVEEYMSAPFIPTPRAAFRGINLLAKGYGDEPGMGNIMALDIGGATTDFYSNVGDNPLYDYHGDDPLRKVKRTILKTPNTPLAYRRVEGKYGLAYDAENIKELHRFQNGLMQRDMGTFLLDEYPDFQPTNEQFGAFVQRVDGQLDVDLDRYLDWLSANPHALPTRDEENAARSFLAKEIMAATTGRNVGYVKETDTYFLQYGVNFLNQPCMTLLIGGTIYHKCKAAADGGDFDRDLRLIAAGTQYHEEESWILRPQGRVLLDAAYMVSIVGGLYGYVDPHRALRMLKRNLVALA